MRRQNLDEGALSPMRDRHYPHGVIEELMMGAYSASRLSAADPVAETPAPAPTQEPVTHAPESAGRPARATSTIVSKTLAWLFFLGGLAGAVLGIASLHVEITVAGLILACTAGLVLLKIRADRAIAAETA
ncbi:hypothetical protein [Nocardia farcinica]|uniref:hypothetical protein n=1 Tax=Nocardia farcinica TaxID=37329 RepID=UPI0018947521|nr:hypothetical protein [Nocardia farcinica]